MSGSKQFDRVAVAVTALLLALTLLLMSGAAPAAGTAARSMGYEDRLFDRTRVHSVDIVMDDWDTLLANAVDEEYYVAHVVIDGESYQNVGLRAKGNTSLSTVASLGSQRYSFKLEFDHYDSGQTYHGLDKLSLNNLIQDATMLKDYLAYSMMNEFGVASSLCSFVYITVNGEDWGLYLAVEGVEEAFLERNYGADYGELYKPDSTGFGGGRGNGRDFDPAARLGGGDGGEAADGGGLRPGNEGGGMGSADVKLQYIDDDPDSYANIWDNAKTGITEADKKRLIGSLQTLSSGGDIESVVDVEQVLRYFVVHNYVCNGDSYTGSMVHNYYLYEKDGRLAMLPWDYNLGFGAFGGGDAAGAVNTPIDSPVSGGSGEDRPMWYWILSDESYTERYHQYFAEFLRSVDVQGLIDDACALIRPYVAKDPTAFYTCEEFETAVEALRQFCALRSESITQQLANGETTEDMGYADASALDLSDMGGMNGGMGGMNGGMGGGMEGFGGGMPGRGEDFDPSDLPEGFDPSDLPENFDPGELPEDPGAAVGPSPGGARGQTPQDLPEDFDPSDLPGNFGGGAPEASSEATAEAPASGGPGTAEEGGRLSGGRELPGGEASSAGSGSGSAAPDAWLWLGASVLVLAAGLLAAKKYRGGRR